MKIPAIGSNVIKMPKLNAINVGEFIGWMRSMYGKKFISSYPAAVVNGHIDPVWKNAIGSFTAQIGETVKQKIMDGETEHSTYVPTPAEVRKLFIVADQKEKAKRVSEKSYEEQEAQREPAGLTTAEIVIEKEYWFTKARPHWRDDAARVRKDQGWAGYSDWIRELGDDAEKTKNECKNNPQKWAESDREIYEERKEYRHKKYMDAKIREGRIANATQERD